MIRKNLIAMLLAVVATAAVCGPASAATPQQTEGTGQQAAQELDVTRAAWMECIRAAIPRLDHPPAISDVVARAAMDSCADKYSDMVRALSRTLVPSCGQDSNCTRAALAKAEREASRTAIDEVMTARIRVAGAQVLECL
jgi:hypothetical protein